MSNVDIDNKALLQSQWGSNGQGALVLRDADDNDRAYLTVNDYEDNGTVYHGMLDLGTNLNNSGARIDGNGIISVQQASNNGNNAAEMFADGDVGVINLNDATNQNAVRLLGSNGSLELGTNPFQDGIVLNNGAPVSRIHSGGVETITLDGDNRSISINSADNSYQPISLQDQANGGEIFVSNSAGHAWAHFQSEFQQQMDDLLRTTSYIFSF